MMYSPALVLWDVLSLVVLVWWLKNGAADLSQQK